MTPNKGGGPGGGGRGGGGSVQSSGSSVGCACSGIKVCVVRTTPAMTGKTFHFAFPLFSLLTKHRAVAWVMAILWHATMGGTQSICQASHISHHTHQDAVPWFSQLRSWHQQCSWCAGVWEAINVLDAAYENNKDFQPRTLSIAVQDKPGVLNEVFEC